MGTTFSAAKACGNKRFGLPTYGATPVEFGAARLKGLFSRIVESIIDDIRPGANFGANLRQLSTSRYARFSTVVVAANNTENSTINSGDANDGTETTNDNLSSTYIYDDDEGTEYGREHSRRDSFSTRSILGFRGAQRRCTITRGARQRRQGENRRSIYIRR